MHEFVSHWKRLPALDDDERCVRRPPALRTPPEPIAYGKVPGPHHRATRTGSKRQSRESELAAVDHAFDLGLRLGPVEAVFGDQLGHQLLLASQGADLDFGELVPLGTNVLAES